MFREYFILNSKTSFYFCWQVFLTVARIKIVARGGDSGRDVQILKKCLHRERILQQQMDT